MFCAFDSSIFTIFFRPRLERSIPELPMLPIKKGVNEF
jgi:hypothetical protein